MEVSAFFGLHFDAVLAWGLLFLLSPQVQVDLLGRVAPVLQPGGKLLFTAPAVECSWVDALTGRESFSLGAAGYRATLEAVGLRV